jgi:hypothetical protein
MNCDVETEFSAVNGFDDITGYFIYDAQSFRDINGITTWNLLPHVWRGWFYEDVRV